MQLHDSDVLAIEPDLSHAFVQPEKRVRASKSESGPTAFLIAVPSLFAFLKRLQTRLVNSQVQFFEVCEIKYGNIGILAESLRNPGPLLTGVE